MHFNPNDYLDSLERKEKTKLLLVRLFLILSIILLLFIYYEKQLERKYSFAKGMVISRRYEPKRFSTAYTCEVSLNNKEIVVAGCGYEDIPGSLVTVKKIEEGDFIFYVVLSGEFNSE